MNICRIVSRTANKLFVREKVCTNLLSFRNTFIVKRKIPPPVSRFNAERKRILKGRNFIYDTVENTNLTPPPDLHVVLTTFVDGIGDVGEVISVDPFYARQNLLLPMKAEYATPENIQKYAFLKKNRAERPKFSSINAGTMVQTLSKVVIPVFMNKEESWTLQKNHIHIAFRIEGFHVPEDAIELPATPIEGPDPVKEAADFAVFVIINNTEKVPVRCRIFYIAPGLETTKLSEDYYLDKGEPILQEQKDLLETMPTPEILDDLGSSISLIEKYRIQYMK